MPRRRRALCALFVSLVVPLACATATAPCWSAPETAAAEIETAEQLYAKLDYGQAKEVAERVLARRGLTHDELVRAYRILAITSAILDAPEQSREAFLKLLVYDPDYTVDMNLGPKVTTPFVEARGVVRSYGDKPGIVVVPNLRREGGQLRVTTRDPRHVVKRVAVGYRWTSAGDYTVSKVEVGRDVPVDVAPAPKGRARLDFFAQAFDERDNAVFEAGNRRVPKSAFVEAATTRVVVTRDQGGGGGSLLSNPLFWFFTGAAVIGGGTALYFAVRPEEPPTSTTFTPQIRCGDDLCR